MTKRKRQLKPALKTFDVGYCVEQGFSIPVRATSAGEAEDIIKDRLDEECDVLRGSVNGTLNLTRVCRLSSL